MVCDEEKNFKKIRKRLNGGLFNPPFRLMDEGGNENGKMVFNEKRC